MIKKQAFVGLAAFLFLCVIALMPSIHSVSSESGSVSGTVCSSGTAVSSDSVLSETAAAAVPTMASAAASMSSFVSSSVSSVHVSVSSMAPCVHNWTSTVTQAPTYVQEGQRADKCTVCGRTKTEKIPSLMCAGDTAYCGESLLMKPLPHAPMFDIASAMSEKYGIYNGGRDSAGTYSVPAGTDYIEGLKAFGRAYRYIEGQIRYRHTDEPDGSTSLAVFYRPDTDRWIRETYGRAFGILKELGIDSTVTQKEAIIRINQWLCEFKEYNDDAVSLSFYDCLKDREGVCAHFAVAFQVLCLSAGIECHYYVSYAMNHAFNRVWFPDGSSYWVDVTWNDGRNQPLRYLLLTTEQFLRDHRL